MTPDTILQGDCTNVMRRFADHSVDLIVADHPYGTSGHRWDTRIDLTALSLRLSRIEKIFCSDWLSR